MIDYLKNYEDVEESILNMGPEEMANALWKEREKMDPDYYIDEELYDLGVTTLVEKLFDDDDALDADCQPEEFGAVAYMISNLCVHAWGSCKEFDRIIYIKCVGVYVGFKYFGTFYFDKKFPDC